MCLANYEASYVITTGAVLSVIISYVPALNVVLALSTISPQAAHRDVDFLRGMVSGDSGNELPAHAAALAEGIE